MSLAGSYRIKSLVKVQKIIKDSNDRIGTQPCLLIGNVTCRPCTMTDSKIQRIFFDSDRNTPCIRRSPECNFCHCYNNNKTRHSYSYYNQMNFFFYLFLEFVLCSHILFSVQVVFLYRLILLLKRLRSRSSNIGSLAIAFVV